MSTCNRNAKRSSISALNNLYFIEEHNVPIFAVPRCTLRYDETEESFTAKIKNHLTLIHYKRIDKNIKV